MESRLFCGGTRIDIRDAYVARSDVGNFFDFCAYTCDCFGFKNTCKNLRGDYGIKVVGKGVCQLVIHVAYVVVFFGAEILSAGVGTCSLVQVDFVIVGKLVTSVTVDVVEVKVEVIEIEFCFYIVGKVILFWKHGNF